MKIVINNTNHLDYQKLYKWGLRHVGYGMVDMRNYYIIFNEQLFLLAVMKHGFDFSIYNNKSSKLAILNT
jgi:hypothetical protein